jgi:UDP-3-O-[3-hydroxymyristoyl] glucosamine N-acyltransferase
MKFTVEQIAYILQGEVVGNPQTEIITISPIDKGVEGAISFLSNPAYEAHIYNTQASAVIVAKDFIGKEDISTTLIKVENPYIAFSLLMQKVEAFMHPARTGIEQPCFIAASAIIGEDVYIGAFAYIGEHTVIEKGAQIYPHVYLGDHVKIGANTIVRANVSVYSHTTIGKNVLIHSGAVIGSDGFGHAPQADGSYSKIPHLGNVVVEDFVEVGANTTIDRGTIGSTYIRKGVKLDNLIQIAHNVEVGENTVIAAQTGVAGSAKIGKNCMIGGQVGIVGHIVIADGVKVGAQSGIGKTIATPSSNWRGSPAQDYRQQLKSEVVFQQLAQLLKRVEALEKK